MRPASADRCHRIRQTSVHQAPNGEQRTKRRELIMQVGMIGLGRMGANMVRRLLKAGHDGVVFDMSSKAVAELVAEKAIGSSSLADFIKKLTKPRAVCLMVPAAVVDKTIAELPPLMEPDDII